MRSHLHLAILTIAMVALSAPAGAQQKVNDEPLTQKWAPSEWGPDDKIGAPNRTTPELVFEGSGSCQARKDGNAWQNLCIGRTGIRFTRLEADHSGATDRGSFR